MACASTPRSSPRLDNADSVWGPPSASPSCPSNYKSPDYALAECGSSRPEVARGKPPVSYTHLRAHETSAHL
eukprot:8134867-Alexandrium_andersonii.AAC.1